MGLEENNRKSTLYVICGPIGSGKSTYARKLAEEKSMVVVNDDAIVTAIHGGNYSLYDKSLKPLYKGVEQNIISHALCLGKDVIVDRTNYSRKMRARYLSLARSFDATPKLVLFDWPSAELSARTRFEADPRGNTYKQWLEAAQRHLELYEEPDPALEDFHAEHVIRVEREYEQFTK